MEETNLSNHSFFSQATIYSLLFILCTIVGTLSHELGHYATGETLGWKCKLSYASCRCLSQANITAKNYLNELYATYGDKRSIPDEEWRTYKDVWLDAQSGAEGDRKAEIWITIGGPIQTMVTGILGLVFLIRRRWGLSTTNQVLDWTDLFLVFLSLFWLREPFNLLLSICKRLIKGEGSFFGGDELKMSLDLQLWEGSFSVLFAFVGLMISLYVVFRIIPKQQRIQFIIGGMAGGPLGYLLWMKFLGPFFLP